MALIAYPGGKAILAKKIASLLPPHTCYVEPFCGAASVFFAKAPAEVSILNDTNDKVLALFCGLRDYPHEMQRILRLTPYSRASFEEAKAFFKTFVFSHSLDLPTRGKAAAFAFLLYQLSFGGKGDHFCYQIRERRGRGGANVLSHDSLEAKLPSFVTKLKTAVIEKSPASDLIARCDRPGVLLYCDPPYPETAQAYQKGLYFSEDDLQALEEQLGSLSHATALVSMNRPPVLHPARWHVLSLGEAQGSMASKQGKASKTREEWLWVANQNPPLQKTRNVRPSHSFSFPSLGRRKGRKTLNNSSSRLLCPRRPGCPTFPPVGRGRKGRRRGVEEEAPSA